MAQLQISAEKFDELTDCSICLRAYVDPQALPCQHYLCRACVEQLLKAGQSECPICRLPFIKDQLKPFHFYNQLQEIIERKAGLPIESGVCSECGRRVGDKNKDLRPGTTFGGKICADCAATEELIKSMESSAVKERKQEAREFCLEVTCPGTPCCPKRHVYSMVM